MIDVKYRRKFQPIEEFTLSNNKYYLLPFKFHQINQTTEIIVNEIGDYLFLPVGTSKLIVNREIDIDSELFKNLVSNFFISNKPIPDLIDVISTRYRTKKAFLESFTSLHIFVITLRCNHSCHYCQVSRQTADKEKFDLSRDNLIKSIDHMFLSPAQNITMEFQGGEPLLAFDDIKFAVTRAHGLAKKFNKEISFVICTNLTIINEDILDFFKEYEILVSTSIDGPDFIHNKNRPIKNGTSYEQVINNIKVIRDHLGPEKLSALMTTSVLSLDYPIEIINTYIENGFNNIFLRPISPYGFALRSADKNQYDANKFLKFYKTGLDYIISLNKNEHRFVEDYAVIILKKILTPFSPGYVDLQSPAGLINSVIVYNYDGFVYATDESRMLAEIGDNTFCLGHVNENYYDIFYGKKAFSIAQYWANETIAGCSECGFQSFCGADPVGNYATQKSIYGHRPSNNFCNRNMEIIRYLLDLMYKDPETERMFIDWVN